jgi:toxin ParE1/3/4
MARTVRLIWTESALADVDAAAAYITRDSKVYAAAFVKKVRARARSLKRFPESGALVLELGDPNTREVYVSGYRLIYAVEPEQVAVLRVIHGARDFWRAWN